MIPLSAILLFMAVCLLIWEVIEIHRVRAARAGWLNLVESHRQAMREHLNDFQALTERVDILDERINKLAKLMRNIK